MTDRQQPDGMVPLSSDFVFLSHPSSAATFANALCRQLEASGIRCWIAPRDIPKGAEFDATLMAALKDCSALLLVFTEETNDSAYVMSEVNTAFSRKVPIFTLRLEQVEPTAALELYLGRNQWTDALDHDVTKAVAALSADLAPVVGAAVNGHEPQQVLYNPHGVPRGCGSSGRPNRLPRLAVVVALMAVLAVIVALNMSVTGGKENPSDSRNKIDKPAPVDTWQTPPRQVFVIAGDQAVDLTDIEQSLIGSGLIVIERERIDVALQEQDLLKSGHIDSRSASAFGKLLGGHLAVIVEPMDGASKLRVVVVESGRLVASDRGTGAELLDRLRQHLIKGLQTLPLRGRMMPLGDDQGMLSIGTAHGLVVGDRLHVLANEGDEDPIGVAIVSKASEQAADAAVTWLGDARTHKVLVELRR